MNARDERGSMAIEVVLLVPVLLMFMLLVVAGGRYVSVRADIEAAARDAARAASLERSPLAGQQAAEDVIDEALDGFAHCELGQITGNLNAGGVVDVRIDCEVPNDGLAMIGVPGSTQISATGSAPIDTYRRYG